MSDNRQRTTDSLRFTFYVLRFVLAVLFLGPLVAPLFQAAGLPLVADSGGLARDLLSRYVCPTPAKSYTLFGFPMAVCARCWGATIGLWLAWFLFKSQRRENREPPRGYPIENHYRASGSWLLVLGSWFFRMPWVVRLCVAVGALLLWSLEINAWPAAPLPVLLLNGINGAFWAAVFLGSVWQVVAEAALGSPFRELTRLIGLRTGSG